MNWLTRFFSFFFVTGDLIVLGISLVDFPVLWRFPWTIGKCVTNSRWETCQAGSTSLGSQSRQWEPSQSLTGTPTRAASTTVTSLSLFPSGLTSCQWFVTYFAADQMSPWHLIAECFLFTVAFQGQGVKMESLPSVIKFASAQWQHSKALPSLGISLQSSFCLWP